MSPQPVHSVRHTIGVAAPATVVYGLLADAPRWPVLVPSHVHVERIDAAGSRQQLREQLRVWDLRAGHVRSSTVRRVLRPQHRLIDFEQQDTHLPGAPARGTWTVEPDGTGHCLLTLHHHQPAGPGEPPGSRQADVRALLARVRESAEQWERLDELLLSFEDSVHVDGPAELVYDFLYRIGDWADLLPHVDSAAVTEDRPGVQIAALDTCAGETGETLSTRTVRLCFPHAGRIVYQDSAPSGLIAAHSGEWYLVPDEPGVRVVSAHRVMLREQALTAALGEDALLVDARRQVRERLGRAGTEALGLAKWHAESAVRRLR
ncbi:SRPBCC family protein [Streptomyces sp. NPDC001984]|uniref:SRPBCC family protein n=1 Tax=Streptomyces sp. NPDC002619 TaxID=3364655 RepID=UPI0036C3C705